jgi:hypothetical protein
VTGEERDGLSAGSFGGSFTCVMRMTAAISAVLLRNAKENP